MVPEGIYGIQVIIKKHLMCLIKIGQVRRNVLVHHCALVAQEFLNLFVGRNWTSLKKEKLTITLCDKTMQSFGGRIHSLYANTC